MSGLAVVGGNSLIGSDIGAGAPELTVDDGTSAVVVRDLGDAYLLQRHGPGGYTPPSCRGTAELACHASSTRARQSGSNAGTRWPRSSGKTLGIGPSATKSSARRNVPTAIDPRNAPVELTASTRSHPSATSARRLAMWST